jgi:hypothetical protein
VGLFIDLRKPYASFKKEALCNILTDIGTAVKLPSLITLCVIIVIVEYGQANMCLIYFLLTIVCNKEM